MDANDDTLLEQAQAGDRGALGALLERHQPRVYRFGLKMCRDPEDAKDILQDTLLAVARNVKEFRGASSVSTWLYTIARSFCIKKRRRSKFAPAEEASLDAKAPGEEARQIADTARGPDESLAGREAEAALEGAIGGLEPMYREVLVLRDVEGLSAAETAEVTGISVEAVKSRLHRARVAVRERLAPFLSGEPAPAPPQAAVPDAKRAPPLDSGPAGPYAQGERGATPPTSACPDVVHLFSQHLEGEISSPLCAEMERHLASCPSCRDRCASLQRTLALCKAAPLPEVPAKVQASVRQALKRFISLHQP
jgi:RNA polymerase sigma-70 factor (ECF subfamily)